jgi:hypothetical protein
MLDSLYKKSVVEEITPVNIPKVCVEKYTDIKEYKRQYYLWNIEKYRLRNATYRKNKKEEKEKAEKQLLNNKNIIIV